MDISPFPGGRVEGRGRSAETDLLAFFLLLPPLERQRSVARFIRGILSAVLVSILLGFNA